jgi:hypothetical protein
MSNTSAPAVLDTPQPRPGRAVIAALLLILTDAHAPTLVAALALGLVLACALLLGVARSGVLQRRGIPAPRLGGKATFHHQALPSTGSAGHRRLLPSCVRP